MKVAVIAGVLLVVAGSPVGAGDEPVKLKVTMKRKDDAGEVRAEKDRAVLILNSPFGISQAIIERTNEKWPEAVVLRLHLKGLENFRASNGKVTLEAAVSSHGEGRRVRVWKDDKEDTPLDEKSPFWVDIRLVGGDGKPAKEVPLRDGYFEITLPRAFFEANPQSITLNWIDFYRR